MDSIITTHTNIPILSILTPAVPSRFSEAQTLMREIMRQIGEHPVEHLVLFDNKKRTVGGKRDALLRFSRGKYVAFVDDDDWVAESYVDKLVNATLTDPDVITFEQHVTYNGKSAVCQFKLGNDNEPFKPGATFKRNAWHNCAWRRTLALQSSFPPVNFGEDQGWAVPLWKVPNLREVHVPEILHYYRHDDATTEAPAPCQDSTAKH